MYSARSLGRPGIGYPVEGCSLNIVRYFWRQVVSNPRAGTKNYPRTCALEQNEISPFRFKRTNEWNIFIWPRILFNVFQFLRYRLQFWWNQFETFIWSKNPSIITFENGSKRIWGEFSVEETKYALKSSLPKLHFHGPLVVLVKFCYCLLSNSEIYFRLTIFFFE